MHPNHQPKSHKDVWFLVLLFALATLAAFLWLLDPSHQTHDKSRVDWPPAARPRP